jgi:hypothetical protein
LDEDFLARRARGPDESDDVTSFVSIRFSSAIDGGDVDSLSGAFEAMGGPPWAIQL